MTTALTELFHHPLKSRDDYNHSGKINIGRGSSMMNSGSYARRTSSNGSYSTRPMSTLEDSGNPNNRDVYQRSMIQRSDSNRSNNVSNGSEHGGYEETVIEEKRKRINGEGYTLHRYTLGRLLGKGGFAKVYICTAMDTGKNYAVKVVPKANLVKARARQKVRCFIFMMTTCAAVYLWIVSLIFYFAPLSLSLITLSSCKPKSKSTATSNIDTSVSTSITLRTKTIATFCSNCVTTKASTK